MPKTIKEDRPIWPVAPAEPAQAEPEDDAQTPRGDIPVPTSGEETAPPERAA